MKKKIALPLLICFIAFSNCFSQEKFDVRFIMKDTAKKNVLSIYQPIDNSYNFLIKNIEHNFNANDNDFIYVCASLKSMTLCQINGDRRFYLIPHITNDTLTVEIDPQNDSKDWIVFSGPNAAGQKWYNDWIYIPYANFNLASIFDNGGKNYPQIQTDVDNFLNHFLLSLDTLRTETLISSYVYEIIRKDIISAIYGDAIEKYKIVLGGYKYGKPSREDSVQLLTNIKKIYDRVLPLETNIVGLPHGHSCISPYVQLISSTAPQKRLQIFGPYNGYGVLPDSLAMPLLGSAQVINYVYAANEFDKDSAFLFFKEKYPQSEYIPVIENLRNASNLAKAAIGKNKNIVIDTSEAIKRLNSLEDLHASYFQDQKVFIDLWATWCKPCKQEFQFNKQLDSLANKYNIKLVFISVDEDVFKQKWIEDIYNFTLNGFHFRAGEGLLAYLQKTFYGGNSLSIPRYIYMDQKGRIINDNAPRPHFLDKIEDMFSPKE